MPKWLNIIIQIFTVLGSVGAVLARPETGIVVAPVAAGLLGQLPPVVGPFRR